MREVRNGQAAGDPTAKSRILQLFNLCDGLQFLAVYATAKER